MNDLGALAEAIDDETCAVMMEPIQGEGGVNVAEGDYIRGVRELCDERGVLLIFDEVQTGIGRTGKWFGFQQYDVEPDIMTLAKALGGGVAIGAMVAQPEVSPSLKPGTHASTFGGNPLACAASLATLKVIENEDLLKAGIAMSKYIFERLHEMIEKHDCAVGVRGCGMMIGLELNRPGASVFQYCLDNKVRLNCTHDTIIRMLPALNVPRKAVDEGLQVLDDALGKLDSGKLRHCRRMPSARPRVEGRNPRRDTGADTEGPHAGAGLREGIHAYARLV
jgi:acetylornithine/succinyldiaminopimelate/putrescine aminotransferase